MFHLKLRTPQTLAQSHHIHFLNSRHLLFDAALVAALVLGVFAVWLTLPYAAMFEGFSASPVQANNSLVEIVSAPQPAANSDVNALITLTRDRSPQTRVGAIVALGQLGALESLTRVQELEAMDGNEMVQIAASNVEDHLRAHVASVLGLSIADLKYLTANESGKAYATTDSELYARRDGNWQWVSHLPDAPNGIATTTDGDTVYLATLAAGLWRSRDAGTTWTHLQFGSNTPTQLTVTAITVNTQHPWQIYIALAVPGHHPWYLNPLGIFYTNDAGESWYYLPGSPDAAITTRLVLDAPNGYLYGVAEGTPWRYHFLPTQPL